MTRSKKLMHDAFMEVLTPSMGAGAYIKDFRKSDAPQFKGKSEKEIDKMAVAAYLDAKDEVNEGAKNSVISMTKFKNPLLIIHQRHLKNAKCRTILEEIGISFFKTPAHVNDDYYIMYSVIKNNCYVVTLDNFKDHIFEIEKYISDINSIVRNYITEKIINYTPESINSIPKFSKCIQVTNHVYIPTSKGFITI